MQIEVKPVNEVGPCNFCDRGLINDDGCSLSFPYHTVHVLSGKQIQVRMCAECLRQLQKVKL
jgi:hypothetical protein